MVKGIEIFKEYFRDYTDEYVLIGGAACDIIFDDSNASFRVTRDLDMVLIIEALSKEFGEAFWRFVREGGYRNKARSTGEPQFYRFSSPSNQGFPKMIELFSRTEWADDEETVLTPIHIDDSVSSLSAILLNEAYYKALLEGKAVVNGLSVLRPSWLILFKAKAWLDLKDRYDMGEHVDPNDIKKHRNDIVRITAEMVLDECKVEGKIREDIIRFLTEANITNELIHDLKIYGVKAGDITDRLRAIYL